MDRVIGRGGMGTVWLARHLELGVDFAVKLMSPGLVADSAARARFRREARAAARLKSSHVVAVHDFGQDGDNPYLVMELLEGETVAALIDRRGRLELDEARDLVQQACAALSLAHDCGIVHRDIKPSNLFLTQVDSQSVLKVLDFGIARAGGEHETTETTRDGLIVGSPAFLSPEQVNGDELELGTDLWSLAVVAYHLLTGVVPFRRATVTETIARIREGVFTNPSALVSGLPRTLDDFFLTAFQLRAAQRFRSAREFAAAFDSALQLSRAAPSAAVRPRDTTTRDLAPARRRRSTRSLVLGCLGLSSLLSFAAYASRERPLATASAAPSARALPRPQPTAQAEPEVGSPRAAPSSEPARPPQVPSRQPMRSDAARRLRPPPLPSVRMAVEPVPPQLTTDPLFGLPVTGSAAQP
jgi:eukaryotic-like serine/threonine-protein kinase